MELRQALPALPLDRLRAFATEGTQEGEGFFAKQSGRAERGVGSLCHPVGVEDILLLITGIPLRSITCLCSDAPSGLNSKAPCFRRKRRFFWWGMLAKKTPPALLRGKPFL